MTLTADFVPPFFYAAGPYIEAGFKNGLKALV